MKIKNKIEYPTAQSQYLYDQGVSARVWALAWPMMLSNLSTPLLGLVDAAVMGHMSDSRYLAAIAVGATVFSSMYWALAFLKAGTTGLVAQAYGRSDRGAANLFLLRALFLAVVLGLVLVLCQRPLLNMAQWIFKPPSETLASVAQYFLIRIWSAPAALATLVIIGWFVGNHNTRVPLIILMLSNAANAIFNVILVFYFGLKADGVALGTVCAEYLGLIIGLLCLFRHTRGQLAHLFVEAISSLGPFLLLLRVNVDYFLRTLCLIFTFAFFTRQGALLGKDMLAANEILKTFLLIIALALDGFAHACEALAGSSWSAKDGRMFQTTVRIILRLSLIMAVCLTVLFAVGGRWVLSLLTDISTLETLAETYLIWIIFLPLIGVWSFFFDGLFIGVTDTKVMRNNMFFSVIFCFLPSWYLTQSWGNHGLWFAMICFFASRGIGLGWVFYSRYWSVLVCPRCHTKT